STRFCFPLMPPTHRSTLFPYTTLFRSDRIKDLMGVSTEMVSLKVKGSNLKANGPLLITHWGMSGPAILRLSAWGARELFDKNYQDRKSTRLNSSHVKISYAVFCLKKKT